MQCKYHSDRRAVYYCSSCNAPLCEECTEEIKPGVYSCFQCGMIQSVSQVGTTLGEKRGKTAEKKEVKKKWGPFQYFLVVSSILILVMWSVILFGGRPAPKGVSTVAKKGRVLLFMVDGALKRYAHYEGGAYPGVLSELVPKYLAFKREDLEHLKKLSYHRDPEVGYRLSLAKPEKGGMNLVLTPKGIRYRGNLEGATQ